MTDIGQRSPAWEWMDLRQVEVGEGRAVVEMPAVESMRNFQGTVHGGFISMLAEAGFPDVEATSFVSPRAIPKLADAGEVS